MHSKAKVALQLSGQLMLTACIWAQSSEHTITPQPAPPAVAEQQAQASSGEELSHTAPVFWISSVEVMRSTHAPQLDVVRVRGLASTQGWESAELVPLTRGIPADGILDLALVAEAPEDSSTPTAYPEIEAVFTIEPGHPFKGVRVHGASNRVALNTFPGYAQSAAPPKDCANCQGRLFVSKGQTAPAGTSALVREEDLPHNLRVIRESDGIGRFDSDPNRMTILLDEKGRIIMALWD